MPGNFKASLTKLGAVFVLTAAGILGVSVGTFTNAGAAKAVSNATAIKNAKAVLAPYEGKTTAFPVSVKLNKRPRGASVAVMNCGTPVCGLLWSLIQGAGKVMGVHLTDYMAGPAVQQTATAFSSMMLTKPSAVIILPTSPLLIEADLLKLKSMKIPVVTSGITWTAAQAKKYHIGAQQSGAAWAVLGGKLLAASTVEMKGTSANAVIQNVPDLEFGNLLTATYISEMKTLCPQCTVSTLSIPIATMGTTDITQEIANLQANPKVNVVASVSSETFFGMPAALSAAGIHVALIGNAPAPLNLKNIVAGTEAGGVGFDLVVSAWTDIDAVARLLDGQAVSHDEVIGLGDQQFLNKKSLLALGPVALKITEAQGWTGYPDFAARFKALWGL